MRFKDKITVKMNAMDAALASVLLAENAGRLALNALLADKTAEVGGTTNKDSRALSDAYIRVGKALAFAILDASENRGKKSTMTFAMSALLDEAVIAAADKVGTAEEADE